MKYFLSCYIIRVTDALCYCIMTDREIFNHNDERVPEQKLLLRQPWPAEIKISRWKLLPRFFQQNPVQSCQSCWKAEPTPQKLASGPTWGKTRYPLCLALFSRQLERYLTSMPGQDQSYQQHCTGLPAQPTLTGWLAWQRQQTAWLGNAGHRHKLDQEKWE